MNHHPSLITVIIFVNDISKLDNTFASIACQTLAVKNILCIYKGSSKEVTDVSFKWANISQYLKIISPLTLAKNTFLIQTVKNITTKFFLCLEAGDILLPNACAQFEKAYQEYPQAASIVQYSEEEDLSVPNDINDHQNIIGVQSLEEMVKWFYAQSPKAMHIQFSGMLIRTDLFNKLRSPFSLFERICSIYPHISTLLRFAEQGESIIFLPSKSTIYSTPHEKTYRKISKEPYRLLEYVYIGLKYSEMHFIDVNTAEQWLQKIIPDIQDLRTNYSDVLPFCELDSHEFHTYREHFCTLLIEYDMNFKYWENAYRHNAHRNVDPEHFIPYIEHPPLETNLKTIAFYLPQFHPFPENDQWWGKGFTEWTNVGQTQPKFEGHYQPHVPIHTGYYDLRLPSVMQEQVKLAKNYGIYGFNYYFYWLNGKTLMEQPLRQMLENPDIDMPFCLTWANHSWTRSWDNAENEVLIELKHSIEDSRAFINYILPYLKDKRYITINGRPLITIFRTDTFPQLQETVLMWRQEVQKAGLPDPYIVSTESYNSLAPDLYGLDASIQFPPMGCNLVRNEMFTKQITKDFIGKIFSYNAIVQGEINKEEPLHKRFRTAMLSWDNTARRNNKAAIYNDFSLEKLKLWFTHLVSHVKENKKFDKDEKIVFLFAWNEWAEGVHLEPDNKYGYGYLQTIYDILKNESVQ